MVCAQSNTAVDWICRQLDERGVGLSGHHRGDRGLARSRRSPEEHRHRLARRQSAQRRSRPEEVGLAHDLVQGALERVYLHWDKAKEAREPAAYARTVLAEDRERSVVLEDPDLALVYEDAVRTGAMSAMKVLIERGQLDLERLTT